MTSLPDLLSRVEGATEASAQLLIEVAAKAYPEAYTARWDPDEERVEWRVLRFERFLIAGAWNDAVLALCERVLPSNRLDFHRGEDGSWCAAVAPGTAISATPALALLAAMLRALIAQEDVKPFVCEGDGASVAESGSTAQGPKSDRQEGH